MKHEDDTPRQPRRNRLIREHIHDPYKTRLKLPEPTVCPQCGADSYPAGELTIAGEFLSHHKEDVLHLARHQEEQEKAKHPLHRIMGIDAQEDAIVVRTTDIHLPPAMPPIGPRSRSRATGAAFPTSIATSTWRARSWRRYPRTSGMGSHGTASATAI